MHVAVFQQAAGFNVHIFESDGIADDRAVVIGFRFGQAALGVEQEIEIDAPRGLHLGIA